MSDPKAETFVRRVCAQTLSGAIDWEATSVNDSFQSTIAGFIVRFACEERSSGDGNVYVLKLFNDDGDLIDTYDNETLDGHPVYNAPRSYFNTMREAYGKVRRQVMGVDEALDLIIKELE